MLTRSGRPAQALPDRYTMQTRGSLGVHAERCLCEPWPGSGYCRSGPDAGAVAIRAFLLLHRSGGNGSPERRRKVTGRPPAFTPAAPALVLAGWQIPPRRSASAPHVPAATPKAFHGWESRARQRSQPTMLRLSAAYGVGVAPVIPWAGASSTTSPTAGSDPSLRISPVILPGM
jgi:hypothetical protein